MKRRPRRQPTPGEFEDPLSNYDQPVIEDELEKHLTDDTVVQMQVTPFTTIGPDATVREALQTMVNLDVACLMVVEGDRLLGVFSERDVLAKVAENFEQVAGQPISSVMTENPVVVYETDSPGKALNQMAVGGVRHVPVLDVDDRVVGIIGPRRVTKFLQEQFLHAGG